MKCLVIMMAFFLLGCGDNRDEANISAYPQKLAGAWKSNWDLTRKHIIENAKITDDQMKIFAQLFGRLTVTHTDKEFIMSAPKYTMKLSDGETTEVEAIHIASPMRIIGQTDSQVAVFATTEMEGEVIVLFQFVDEDTYWIYVAHSNIVDLHLREYFTRVVKRD